MYQGKYENGRSGRPAQPRNGAPRKRRRSKSTLVFYSIYTGFAALVLLVTLLAIPPLRGWLEKFEASQPDHRRDEVFAQYFENRDWSAVYDKLENPVQNREEFVAYMTDLVGDQTLSCLETSAGLSGGKKYIVAAGTQQIATFRLMNQAPEGSEIPDWQLNSIDIQVQILRQESTVTVLRLPGQTVYVNGTALDDSYTVKKVSTVAEKYLPEGVHGYQIEYQRMENVPENPEISVKNADGTEAKVTYDAASGVYMQELPTPTASPTEEEKTLAVDAVQVYSKYMIKRASLGEVRKHFSTDSQIYNTISRSEVGWMQDFKSYTFTEPEFVDYYRYSDSVFSLGVKMVLKVTRNDGSIKDYDLNNQLFFEKNSSGKYVVREMTNVAVQEQVVQVRLVFKNGEEVLQNEFVDADARSLTLPTLEGVKAWVLRIEDAKGNVTLNTIYDVSDGKTTVALPGNPPLESMVLYAYFGEEATQ